MQTPLVSGREFTADDVGNPNVAIVNEAFARRYFPGQNPVGQYLSATVTRPPADLQVVGLVKNTITDGLREAAPETVYVAFFQHPHNEANLEIRVAGSLSQVSAAIRKELQPRLPSAPVEVRALSEQVEGTLTQERMMATLASGFGVLALLLACIGLYGLLAYSVARRTKELGIRMALGAQRRGVIAMVVRNAVTLVLVGIALGLPAAWAASRLVKSMLFGLTPTDPATILGAASVLATAALLAAYLPALRASRVDPMTALRHE
jgi:predicted permease